jgi:hypothetical protein
VPGGLRRRDLARGESDGRCAPFDAAQRELLGFEARTLEAQPNPGFEGIWAPAVYKSAAVFEGRIYLAGPAGLYAYAADGTLERIYRTGIDLPAAPLGQMAVGMLVDAKRPELLIATLGEGILCFDGHLFRQILGTNEDARVITSLLPLGSGRLLIGTAKMGLLIYDGKTLKRFHTTTNNVYVTALAGSEAELWVGTLNDGLLWWHGGQTDRIGEEQGLPDRRVEQIALAGGKAYVGTPMGVAEVREGKIARVLAKGRYAHALLADGDALLVGQMEAGVMRVPLYRAGERCSGQKADCGAGGAGSLRVESLHPSRWSSFWLWEMHAMRWRRTGCCGWNPMAHGERFWAAAARN